MLQSVLQLGRLIKIHREQSGISQDKLVEQLKNVAGINRSTLAHLEQGLRMPKPIILRALCEALKIPDALWLPFVREESQDRFRFEELLGELIGRPVSIEGHDFKTIQVVESHIGRLLDEPSSPLQTYDKFNSILLFYGISPCSREFVQHYFSPPALSSLNGFESAVKRFQKDAIRLFSSFETAFSELNRPSQLNNFLLPLSTHRLDRYAERSEWNVIREIPNEHLPDLGYISARRVRQEATERKFLQGFLEELAKKLEPGDRTALDQFPTKTRRKVDSLLRKFETKIEHGLFSPLFAPDADQIRREAQRLAPKSDDELNRMAETQETALGNLSNYISADYLDIYVATSMRTDADFVSVNHFVRSLFAHELVRPNKLRYFNPTQSWIDDRIAKGLVEAIMLRRSDVTIYMAQKGDTFGKDSEASVALGQGKPVIVYVPKLSIASRDIDSEDLFKKARSELISMLPLEEQQDIDETVDAQALISRVLAVRLEALEDREIVELIREVWADFDLQSDVERVDSSEKTTYRNWIEACVSGASANKVPRELRQQVVGILVANAVRFEDRARVFREVHPLALQVILSTGVLNGILVVRSIEQCAEILTSILKNDLDLELIKDDQNYKLIERKTGSTIRVISRHRLLSHGFETFFHLKAGKP